MVHGRSEPSKEDHLAKRLLHDAPGSEEEAEPTAEESRIRTLGNRWTRAVTRGDLDELARLLSERAVMLPPNADSIKGRDDIARAWRALLELPGFRLTFEPHRTNVYPTGDVAHDISRYRLSWHDTDGRRIADHGNHLIVWERRGDGDDTQWRVRSNVFYSKSMDRPCPLSIEGTAAGNGDRSSLRAQA